MTARARVTEATLVTAARVATAEGVRITIEVGSKAYKIEPVAKPEEPAQDQRLPEPW